MTVDQHAKQECCETQQIVTYHWFHDPRSSLAACWGARSCDPVRQGLHVSAAPAAGCCSGGMPAGTTHKLTSGQSSSHNVCQAGPEPKEQECLKAQFLAQLRTIGLPKVDDLRDCTPEGQNGETSAIWPFSYSLGGITAKERGNRNGCSKLRLCHTHLNDA